MDRAKVEAFQEHLAARGQTFLKWLDEQIEKEPFSTTLIKSSDGSSHC